MELSFKNQKTQKLCEDCKKVIAKYGNTKAKRIIMRIGDLLDATNLYDVSKLPQARLHPLQGNRKGQFSIDTFHPYRMIFIPLDGEIGNFKTITSVEIISINEDYH